MKYSRCLSFLLLLVGLGCLNAYCIGPLSPRTNYQKLGANAVTLVYHNEETGEYKPYCSGTFVSEDEILTADHCVQAIAEKMETTSENAKIHFIMINEVTGIGEEPSSMHLAKVEKEDADLDLAELKLPNGGDIPVHGWAKVAEDAPEIGEEVASVSSPVGNYFMYNKGYVAQVWNGYHDQMGQVIQVSGGSFFFGSSGGGLINKHGELVGVADFLSRLPGATFFIGCDSVTKFLKR